MHEITNVFRVFPAGNRGETSTLANTARLVPAPGNASAAMGGLGPRLGIDTKLATETGDEFIIYLGSGRDRSGSVREHAAKSNLTVVMIDKKV